MRRCAGHGTTLAASPANMSILTACGISTRTIPTPAASSPTMRDKFIELLTDGKPALCFAAHLANWELPASWRAAHGLPSAVLYRMPNNKAVANEIARIRAPLMGRLIRSRAQAPLEMAGALIVASTSACWSISVSRAAST